MSSISLYSYYGLLPNKIILKHIYSEIMALTQLHLANKLRIKKVLPVGKVHKSRNNRNKVEK